MAEVASDHFLLLNASKGGEMPAGLVCLSVLWEVSDPLTYLGPSGPQTLRVTSCPTPRPSPSQKCANASNPISFSVPRARFWNHQDKVVPSSVTKARTSLPFTLQPSSRKDRQRPAPLLIQVPRLPAHHNSHSARTTAHRSKRPSTLPRETSFGRGRSSRLGILIWSPATLLGIWCSTQSQDLGRFCNLSDTSVVSLLNISILTIKSVNI